MVRFGVVVLSLWALSGAPVSASAAEPDVRFRPLIENDWSLQERRLKREPQSPAAIDAALNRASLLLNDLRSAENSPDLKNEQTSLSGLRKQFDSIADLDDSARLALYRRIRWLIREIAFRNPLIANKPVAFMQRRRYVCQMLHEYLGYYYDEISGGGVYVLPEPGRSLEIRDLIAGRLPEGAYSTLAMSYDAKTLYFAFAEEAAPKPSYYAPRKGDRFFHLYAIDIGGKNLRQLTNEQYDDFDPCPLPDGGIAFMSTRRGLVFGRCHNPWEPLPAYTLHRMDADGKNIRTLSFHETNEWHPSVLHDGRIIYIRWDYVDRSAANFHGLWVANPDGTNPSILFGNYTMRINACYQPKAIPNSNRLLFVAGAHHADVGGSLVIVDPARTSLDAQTGEDDLSRIERLTPEVKFPESEGWPVSYFHSPLPLSEKYFLTAFSFDPLPRMGGPTKDTTGIYYFDRFGNLELLYRADDIACMYPMPLASRPVPPVVKSTVDANLGDEGEFMLTDVGRSFMPAPTSRPVRELRIFQVLPKTTHVANQPRIGHANAESARMLLGTVPVEPDGSAYFRAPAKKPIYFQAIDEAGRAVQTMRSVTYLQSGERRGCVGCHEGPNSAAISSQTLATRRDPSRITPGPDGTRPFSYVRLVQPILDRSCVRCHDGAPGEGKSKLNLTGSPDPKGPFTRSYNSLKPYVRWFEWGDKSICQTVTQPGRGAADASPLTPILEKSKCTDDASCRILYLWLDSNVPFYGVYDKDAQAAQKRGEAVAVPVSQ